MKTQVSILTSTARDSVDQGIADYQNAVAAHIGSDWGAHNQLRYYGTLAYSEPSSGNTIANCFQMRVQLSGINSDGSGDGVFTFPAIDTGSTVTVIGNVPAILVPPVAVSVATGGTALFSVVAASATPMTYQWFKAGAAIAEATDSVYVIGVVAAANAGNYTVAITNQYGVTTSTAVALTVT